jgi:cardiolipin synthase A/B
MDELLDGPFLVAGLLGLGVLVLLGVIIWSIRRHRPPALQVASDLSIDRLAPSLAGLTLCTAVAGNSVEVLENGAFFTVLLERIRAARHTVHFETFLWKEGVLGQRLADALSERARAGKQVRVMLDATGSSKVGEEAVRQMRDAGCKVWLFHKRSLRNLGVLNDRDHRKMVVIDGREAFVGGHCIVDEWLGNAEDGQHYGDVSVRLHGPIVHSVQSAFSENWAGETGELFVGDGVFPELKPAGEVLIHAVFAKPENSAPAVKILHHTAICLARERIWIQNPYFIPELAAIDAFGKAVERGVDVRVLMPSASASDNPMVQHAGHRNFERLLRCGVRLFEYPHTLLHQKVMTVDGVWSAIGSANFDDRSFETNDELTLAIGDAALTRRLDGIFERYAARAQEVELERWQQRGARHKLMDNAFYLVNELL